MLKFGNIILTNNGNWLNIPEHNVITSGNHGTVTASPNKGIQGTEVTLSNTPDTGYEFSSYSVTGATLKNDNQFNIGTTDVNVNGNFTISLNPLNLPANTVRVRTSDGKAPYRTADNTYETATLVPGTSDVYDVYKSGQSFAYLLAGSSNVVEVLGANTTGITDMRSMFGGFSSLRTVSLFDTSNVTNMEGMFFTCTSLTNIPLFNTSKVTNMKSMFYNCTSVQSGALALYQQASTQTTIPQHSGTFYNCGTDTQTGAAELAQIPSDWKNYAP